MPDTQELTLNDVEKRISSLEGETNSQLKKLDEISLICRKIERVLLGDLDSEHVGLVIQVRELKNRIEDFHNKFGILDKKALDLIDEVKKYKWQVRGIIIAAGIIISYSLKIWTLFIKP